MAFTSYSELKSSIANFLARDDLTSQIPDFIKLCEQSLYETYSSSGGGKPKAYTIIGAEIALRPVPDTGYELEIIYGEAIASLSDANTGNTILTRHPDAYLYGSLANAYTYLMDEQRATQYDALFSRIMEEIIRDTEKARYGGGGLSMKTQYGI